jgi:large subunit ribosomal protein L24
MKKFKIKSGDTVKVIAGDHKGLKEKFYKSLKTKQL